MSVAAAVVLVAYVVGGIADADLGSSAATVRIVVLAAAAVVAVVAFQSFSHDSTPHTISAMIVALLGGACLASAVTTGKGHDLYGSTPMAFVGTLAVVAAVTIAQIGQTRRKEAAR
jgi:peptidoglycan/LPS O-acetylase OafA/YrhL